MNDNAPSARPRPQIIPRPEHNVSRDEISKNALKVLYRLHNAGFQAFLVGGCVRDALLGLHPKDFDIATDAHPDEVRALFNNCRLIGRRFRLAHVRFGREIIEVATFRATVSEDEEHAGAVRDEEGRILRDNVYGSVDEDVWRRDFTCNALYYNIADFSIWDYVGGVEDVRRRQLVLIGDPGRRLREDPVRMLRAVRFAAKLDFTIDPEVAQAMHDSVDLLVNVPAARLFDEFQKMFQSGFALRTFELLWEYRLFDRLFPDTAAELDRDQVFGKFLRLALENTDRRVAEGQSVTPMFLLGVFFWAPARRAAASMAEAENVPEWHALQEATYAIVARHQARISIPKRFTAPMREMLALQPRFDKTKGRKAYDLLEHRRFRAAYDFMLLRAQAGEVDAGLADFWTEVQNLPVEERLKRFGIAKGPKKQNRRRPRRRRPRKAGQG